MRKDAACPQCAGPLTEIGFCRKCGGAWKLQPRRTSTPSAPNAQSGKTSRTGWAVFAVIVATVLAIGTYAGNDGTSDPSHVPATQPIVAISVVIRGDPTSTSVRGGFGQPSTVYPTTPPLTFPPTSTYRPAPTYTPPGGYNSAGCPRSQYVSGYYRRNGTYVPGYYRNSGSDGCGGG